MYINFTYSKVTDELLKLQKEQEELQSKLKLRVIGMPLFHTVLEVCTYVKFESTVPSCMDDADSVTFCCFQCIKNRHLKAAEQLRKDFKMSDNQYVSSSYIRVHVFIYVCSWICTCIFVWSWFM